MCSSNQFQPCSVMCTRRDTDDIDNCTINILYDINRTVGQGAYGIVWKGYQRKTKQAVAIKKIFDAFRNTADAQRTFREVSYLKEFKGHPNIIQLLNVHKSNNNMDLFLVFEYMDIDLFNYINSGYFLRANQVKFILYQILKALKYIHSGNVVHRDIKPSNILLNRQCVSKLADFGLARSLSDRYVPLSKPLTDYVATRWYRAPELLLGAKRYTKVIDLWSLGCVFCEMLTGTPMFAGNSTVDQLKLIISLVPSHGHDTDSALSFLGCSRLKIYPVDKKRLEDIFCNVSKDCLDLILKLLTFNPLRRITAVQALRHPYIGRFKNSQSEPFLLRPVIPKFSDDNKLSIEDYRSAIYKLEGRISTNTILPTEIKPKRIYPLRPLMRPVISKTVPQIQNAVFPNAGPSKLPKTSERDLSTKKGQPTRRSQSKYTLNRSRYNDEHSIQFLS